MDENMLKNQVVKIFDQPITWKSTKDGGYQFGKLRIATNSEFPLEDLYTLSIQDEYITTFNDWPAKWKKI